MTNATKPAIAERNRPKCDISTSMTFVNFRIAFNFATLPSTLSIEDAAAARHPGKFIFAPDTDCSIP
jgi:hypothetical protein